MNVMDAAGQAATQRLGGSTLWQEGLKPQLPDFGAMADLPASPQAAPELSAEQQEFRKLVKDGTLDENGMTKDGKMYRGPKANLFVAQNGGRAYVLKDKDLMAQLNKITIAENRELGGLPALEEAAPQSNEDEQRRLAYPKPEGMTDGEYNYHLGVIANDKKHTPEVVRFSQETLKQGSTVIGQKKEQTEEKRRKAMEAQRQSIESARETADSAIRSIAKLRRNMGDGLLPETGLMGRILSPIPGTDAYDLERDLSSLKGLIGLKALGDAKQGSANGSSGFGALSNRELALLENKLGALDAGMGKARLMEALNEIEPLFQRSLIRRELEDNELDPAQKPQAPKRYTFTADGNLVEM